MERNMDQCYGASADNTLHFCLTTELTTTKKRLGYFIYQHNKETTRMFFVSREIKLTM
jgi:hypothetical protein